jgi:Rod binding domain-containing protein
VWGIDTCMTIERVSILRAINAVPASGLERPLDGAATQGPSATGIGNDNNPKVLRNGPAAPTEEDRIKKASTDFEALLLQQMLKSMWTAMAPGEEVSASGGQETDFYRDMLNEQVANDIAQKQSLGIKEILAADMRKRGSKLNTEG